MKSYVELPSSLFQRLGRRVSSISQQNRALAYLFQAVKYDAGRDGQEQSIQYARQSEWVILDPADSKTAVGTEYIWQSGCRICEEPSHDWKVSVGVEL